MATSKAVLEKVVEPTKETPLEERSTSRLLAESELYDFKPTARSLLREIAMMSMNGDEWDTYPEDMPDDFIADRKDWCWMSQWRLGQRAGISERQVTRLIGKFKKEGVLDIRYWYSKPNNFRHAQYKIKREIVIAFQRPSHTKDVERPKRSTRDYADYKNKGGFKKGKDPRRANMVDENVEL